MEGLLGVDARDLQRLRARDVAEQSAGLKARRCRKTHKHFIEVRLHLDLGCAAHLHQLLPVLGECAGVISYRLDVSIASCGLQSLEHGMIRVQF